MTDDAHVQAMAIVIQESLTRPMTVQELGLIFWLSFRGMKRLLAQLDTVKSGSLYRRRFGDMLGEWLGLQPQLKWMTIKTGGRISFTEPLACHPDQLGRSSLKASYVNRFQNIADA